MQGVDLRCPPAESYQALLHEGLLDWLWLVVPAQDDFQLPLLAPDGGSVAQAVCQDHDVQIQCPAQLRPGHRDDSESKALRVDLRILTYNTLSLVTRGQASVLASEMRRHSLKLLALQECRECADAIRFHDGICKVTIQLQDGRFGCQVWIDCAKPLGSTCDGDQIAWNRRSMALLYSEPRILVVGAQAGMRRFAIVSAQACTSVAPHEDKQKFWDDLGKAMKAIRRGYIPLLMCDANARFDPGIEVPHKRCYNASRFLELLQRRSLRMSGNIDANGVDIVSWVHPGLPESKSCIDYVAVPKAWPWI